MYRVHSWLLMGGLLGLSALVAQVFFGWFGGLAVLGAGLAVNGLAADRGAWMVLRLHRARPLAYGQGPRLHAMVADLARKADIAPPQLMYYPADMPNAFALGPRSGPGVVAVSTALLRLLNERETYGVLAHEVAHLKNRDSILSLTAGMLVRAVSFISQAIGLTLLLLAVFGGVGDGPPLPALALLLAAPPLALLLQAGLMRARERLADQIAAELTGDPRGLAAALYRLQEYGRRLAGWLRRFRFIYTAEAEGGSRWLRTHPPTGERIAALLALEEGRVRLAG